MLWSWKMFLIYNLFCINFLQVFSIKFFCKPFQSSSGLLFRDHYGNKSHQTLYSVFYLWWPVWWPWLFYNLAYMYCFTEQNIISWVFLLHLYTCEISWKFHAQLDVEIFTTWFFPKNGKKDVKNGKKVLNFGIHGCIVLYPIRLVMLHAISKNYCTCVMGLRSF